jgi:DivIVA domain-containing protein
MSEERPPVPPMPPPGSDLIPGMVTVIEPVGQSGHEPWAPREAPGQTNQFDLVLRGYDRHQVDAHLDRVAAVVEQLRVELTESARRESATTAELAMVRAEMERGKPSFDALGERVSQMLRLAESEAAQLRSDADHDAKALRQAAEREAADIRSDARRDAEELGASARRELAELNQQRVTLLTEMADMRDTLDSILGRTSEQWVSLAPSAAFAAPDPGQTASSGPDDPAPEDSAVDADDEGAGGATLAAAEPGSADATRGRSGEAAS